MLEITPTENEVSNLVLQSLTDILNGSDHELLIHNFPGYSVRDYVIFHLGQLSINHHYTKHDIAYLDLYFENANGAEDVLLEKLNECRIALVDGSEQLCRFPRLREALMVSTIRLATVYLQLGEIKKISSYC